MQGGKADEQVVESAMPMIERCLIQIARLQGDDAFLAGPELSLADLYVAPVVSHLHMTPEAEPLLRPHNNLRRWWETMSGRPAMAKTQPSFS